MSIKLKHPSIGFTFKPVEVKKRVISTHKTLSRVLYAIAAKDGNNEWQALINTKGLEGHEDITVLPFTERSFELKDRINVFYHNRDKYGHWVRVIRTSATASISPGNKETYCTLCENCCFSGKIVKVDNKLYFDMYAYQGTAKECDMLLTRDNKIKHKDEE